VEKNQTSRSYRGASKKSQLVLTEADRFRISHELTSLHSTPSLLFESFNDPLPPFSPQVFIVHHASSQY